MTQLLEPHPDIAWGWQCIWAESQRHYAITGDKSPKTRKREREALKKLEGALRGDDAAVAANGDVADRQEATGGQPVTEAEV